MNQNRYAMRTLPNLFVLLYVYPCIIYENDERYELDAIILFIIINTVFARVISAPAYFAHPNF